MKPKRIQLQRIKGWRKPADAVVVTRVSKWGNRYLAIDLSKRNNPLWIVEAIGGPGYGQFASKLEAIKLAVALFEKYVKKRLKTNPDWLEPLRSKDLCCWCRLDWPCHGDVLLRYANERALNQVHPFQEIPEPL